MSARDPYSNVMRVQNRCEGIDTHELGKQEIYRQGYEGDTGFRFGLSGSVLPPLTGGVVSTATVGNPSGAGVGFEDVELFFPTHSFFNHYFSFSAPAALGRKFVGRRNAGLRREYAYTKGEADCSKEV